MADIYNFVKVSDVLSTSGVIPLERFQHLADESFDLVINLLPSESKYATADEAGIIAGIGLEYVHIPVDFAAPKPEDYAQFASAMEAARGRKVWAHCAANYRVSAFVSIYGQLHLGWSEAEAETLLEKLWQPDEVWRDFIKSELDRGRSRP